MALPALLSGLGRQLAVQGAKGAARGTAKKMLGGRRQEKNSNTIVKQQEKDSVRYKKSSALVPTLKPIDFGAPSSSPEVSSSTKGDDGSLLSIKEKVIKIENLLGEQYKNRKKQAEKQRKLSERAGRKEKEERLEETSEEKKNKGKFNIPIPGKGLFDNLMSRVFNFLFWVTIGKILPTILEFLPQIIEVGKIIGKVMDPIINVAGFLLDGFVTFVDFGFKVYDKIIGFADNIGGDGLVKVIEDFSNVVGKVLNLLLILSMAQAVSGGFRKRGKLGRGVDGRRKTPKITTSGGRAVRKRDKVKDFFRRPFGGDSPRVTGVDKKKGPLQKVKDKFKRKPTITGDVTKTPGFFGRLKDGIGGALEGAKKKIMGIPSWAQSGFDSLSKFGKKQWGKVKRASNRLTNFSIGAFTELAGKAKQFFLTKVIEPLKPILEPLKKKFEGVGKKLLDGLKKIPGYEKVGKLLKEKGITDISKAGSKLGKRAGALIPIVGGLVNLAFAYDRAAEGDSVGALIEGVSGILDLTGVGTIASMGLDAYMFARDFIPALQDGENKLIETLGLGGVQSSIDEVLGKLPNLGEIINVVLGNKKAPEEAKEPIKSSTPDFKTKIEQDKTGDGTTPPTPPSSSIGGNVGALLKTIRWAEGTYGPQGYNTWFGGRYDMDLSEMTINEVVAEQKRRLASGEATYGSYTSAAVGAYQMMKPEVFAAKAGLDPATAKFTPENQDKLAIAGYLKGQAGLTDAQINAPISKKLINSISGIWASLPNAEGKSAYGQPVKSYKDLEKIYNQNLQTTPTTKSKDVKSNIKPTPSPTSDSSSNDRGEGSKLAGELGRFLDSKGLGVWGSGVHQHPEHPPWPKESGHSEGSLHYESQGARAIDIGGWGPKMFKRKGESGTDDQTKIIAAINEFNSSKGASPVEFLHEGNEPSGHSDHVHIAYEGGGLIRPKGSMSVPNSFASYNSPKSNTKVVMVPVPVPVSKPQMSPVLENSMGGFVEFGEVNSMSSRMNPIHQTSRS